MLLAQLWGNGRNPMCPSQRRWVRLWAAAAIRAELVELFALLLERHRPPGGAARLWPASGRLAKHSPAAAPESSTAATPAPKCRGRSGY